MFQIYSENEGSKCYSLPTLYFYCMKHKVVYLNSSEEIENKYIWNSCHNAIKLEYIAYSEWSVTGELYSLSKQVQ